MTALGEQQARFHAMAARMEASLAAQRAANERERLASGLDCLECQDTGRRTWDGAPCRCARGDAAREADRTRAQDDRRAAIIAALDLPARFRDCTLDSFPNPKHPALRATREWLAERPADKPGLFLMGPFGRGKTGLIIGALRAVCVADGEADHFQRTPRSWGCFVTGTAFLESLRPSDEHDPADMLRRYQSVTYLALDDLGAERLTAWGADRLFEVINARHNALKPLLVSSNLPPDALAQSLNDQTQTRAGDRIVDRIVEGCRLVKFTDKDANWRLK